MTKKVFPTELNVGADVGSLESRALTETKWVEIFGSADFAPCYVVSGLDYDSASGLVATFNAGKAMIEGRLVEITEAITLTLPASSTRRVFLQLTVDASGKVDAVTLTDTEEADTKPAISVWLATLTTDATTVTSSTDDRQVGYMHCQGKHYGDISAIYCGFRPRKVYTWGDSDTQPGYAFLSFRGAEYDMRMYTSQSPTPYAYVGRGDGVTFGNYQVGIVSGLTSNAWLYWHIE